MSPHRSPSRGHPEPTQRPAATGRLTSARRQPAEARESSGRATSAELGLDRHFETGDPIQAVVEIAHDMRSPLASILFLVDTLRRGGSGPVTAAQERQLGLVYGAALGLSTLASDVLDAARGARGLFDGAPIPMSLTEVIAGVCDTVRPIAEEKGLELRQEVSSCDARMGHPAALSRVLLNLVSNALKYTREGVVTIGCADGEESRACFWVEDTGEGIPPHVMERLFESFRPAAGERMRFSNAGLGLAICQQFLGMLGSSLAVESSQAKGTRFSFEVELPLAGTGEYRA